MNYLTEIITLLIGAVIGLLFWKIERKIDRMEADNDAHHKEQVRIRMAERELLLAMADTIAITGKKVEDRDGVNGELKEAIRNTKEKKEEVQKITREIAIEQSV